MTKLERYIEVYDDISEELIFSYRIKLNDDEAISYISPDDDDIYAVFMYRLDNEQVIKLGGEWIFEKFKNQNVSYFSSCYSS